MIRLSFLALVLLVLAGPPLRAGESALSPESTAHIPTTEPHAKNALQRFWSWSDARLRGISEAILPETQERRTLRLSVSPHFSDLVREDHIRLPIGLVYGLNNRTEGEVEAEPYFKNPFKDGEMSGIANWRVSFKHRWRPPIDHEVDAASGFAITRPIAGSPYDLTEGVNRYSVFATFARPIPDLPDTEGYVNLSYDFLVPSSAEGEIAANRPQDDYARIVVGAIRKKKDFSYGLSVAWAHTFDGEDTNFVTVTPNAIYNLPRRYTFNMRGQWQLGLALEALRYGKETELDVRVRARWLIDFKKAWREWRESRNGHQDG